MDENENEIQQRIIHGYAKKQKELGEILQIILANPTAEALDDNLKKVRNLIDVNSNSLEFTIKIITRKEMMEMKPKQPVVKIKK